VSGTSVYAPRPTLPDGPSNAPRLFGTDGIREIVGEKLTPEFVTQVGLAVAEVLHHAGTVVIAMDFRTTSPGIARILSGSLQMGGIDVVEVGAMPTPCLQFNVRALGAQMGLMVTASHNPAPFNGIKFSGPRGLEIPRADEVEIETHIHHRSFRPGAWDRAGRITRDPGAIDRYVASMLQVVDAERIRAWAPRVVLDCGNGTSAVASPRMLREVGCRLTTLNANPDGFFPGHPSEPNPQNLGDLIRMVPTSEALLGIAHDGDSDRIAFVDEKGQFVPGEVTLALFARHVLRRRPGAVIVTSVTSSTCIEDVVRAEGGRLIVTRSGSLPVAEAVAESRAAFGGEENGHYYWPEHQNAADGPMSSLKLLELLAYERRPLSDLVAELPKYVLTKTTVPFPREIRPIALPRIHEELARGAERVVTVDGIKAFFHDGWLLIRPSGTEPVCRVFSESRDTERSRALNHKGRELVERATRDTLASSPAPHDG
jgi:phosphomannomutase/phosphoglucomutase